MKLATTAFVYASHNSYPTVQTYRKPHTDTLENGVCGIKILPSDRIRFIFDSYKIIKFLY